MEVIKNREIGKDASSCDNMWLPSYNVVQPAFKFGMSTHEFYQRLHVMRYCE